MFSSLLSKEIRAHLLTFRFAAALATTFALVVVSTWVLAGEFVRSNNAYLAAAEASTLRDLQEVYVPSQISPTIHRAPSPLAIFAEGEEARLGNSVKVHRWEVPMRASGGFNSNALMAALPPFDLLTIFSVVISLFGLLITYDAISGEREAGTLKMLSAGLLRRGTLFGVKFVAAIIILAIPILLSFVGCLLMISFIFEIGFSPAQWLSIAVMAVACLLYASLFAALGLLCSTLVRHSATALILALLVWTLGVMVIPGAAQSASVLIVEPPSEAEIARMQEEFRVDFREFRRGIYDRYPNASSGWTGGWGSDGAYYMWDGLERNFSDTAAYVRETEAKKQDYASRVWALYQSHERKRTQQLGVADFLSAVAPSYQLRQAYTALAGTDLAAYEHFLGFARRYHEQLIIQFRGKGYFGADALHFFTRRQESEISDEQFRQRVQEYMARARRMPQGFARTVSPEAWGPLPADEIPPFAYQQAPPDAGRSLAPMAILLLGTIVVFAVGFVAFVRYDVR